MSHPPLPIGQILGLDVLKDCVHMALVPVIASHRLDAGTHVGLDSDGRASANAIPIGIIDPFLERPVKKGERAFLFLYPGTITSLRHDFSHPSWPEPQPTVAPAPTPIKSESEKWMCAWAVKHMGRELGDDPPRSEDDALASAINAGHNLCVGCYMSARDHIDGEWWGHWEAITGCKGQQGEYFSCAC